ncbi:MAG: single-stranded DNA-binding protein [Desulfobacterales bacterium]|nr:single-stranded DNA-binding protein [Desulfobacterales bacterium]MDD4072027.1 single-stranded DNA-binding protein [Desulfobacterales bacterium]MDD4392604.1 single-stranded DNA-binding protein [Desulfobacterales bacterium]
MAGVNKAIILGNLGKDPEMTYTPSGLAVCKFSLATSKKMKDGQTVTQWHRCTAFGKTGELIAQYVNKGNQLYVEGEITYSQYEKDGTIRYSTDIIVREFNFISGGGGGGGGGDQQGGYQNSQGGGAPQGGGYRGGGAPQGDGYQGNAGYQQGGAPQGGGSGGSTPPEDDIPF